MDPVAFETLAREVFGRRFGAQLDRVKFPGHPKVFDLVSADGKIVGDAKYMSMVRGKRLPPAKWSVIAEHVWLLEKTSADIKFLVFGNDRRVVSRWLDRFRVYVDPSIHFYFMSDDGVVEQV